jgi:hypothetical protein
MATPDALDQQAHDQGKLRNQDDETCDQVLRVELEERLRTRDVAAPVNLM